MDLTFEVADLELTDIVIASMRDTVGLQQSIGTDLDSCGTFGGGSCQ